MKKIILVLFTVLVLFMASAVSAADSAAAVTNTTAVKAAATQTLEQAVPVTTTAAAVTTPVPASKASTAAVETNPFIEGVMPPAIDSGAYEDPGEPAPTAEEAVQAVEKKSEARKKKHFTIEQTLYTPSSIGTKLGYFINENWRVMAEFSTISYLVANSSHEKNVSWSVAGNFSPAEDDWAPFYGAGASMMDLNYSDTVDGDRIKYTKTFTGGYVNAGVTWITDSIFMASIEFDLYCGRSRQKQDNITTPSKSSDTSPVILSVGIGATVGLCF